ncbi:MAG: hypothetical protein ACRDLF_16240 [Solirubrobacteraceae bacterium]
MRLTRSSTGTLIALAVFGVGVVLYAKRSSASSNPSSAGSPSSAPVLPPTLPPLMPDFGLTDPSQWDSP